MGDACFPPASAGVSCLMSAAAVSLGLHQLLCVRMGVHVASRDCSSNVLFTNFGVEPH